MWLHSLAWAELYLTFTHVFRKYELEMDPSRSVKPWTSICLSLMTCQSSRFGLERRLPAAVSGAASEGQGHSGHGLD